jgi:alpha-N-arabinofuranosidase
MIASLALVAGAAQSAEAREPIRIHVETNALHKIDHRLFGQFLERPSWGETGPEIAAGTNGNLSADVVEMLRAMRIPIVRFPGGTDIDFIDWTDMVSNVPGRAPERPMTTGHQGHKVTNRFGYDEYLRLAADLKWDSILVVNFLDALAKKKPLAEAARHAAGLVAYANAPVGAKLPDGMPDWPAVRAKNGHPAPYGVKIFQIGNEWWCGKFPQEVKKALGTDKADVLLPWYRECLIAYVDAMRAVDPTIEFIADAQVGFPVEAQLYVDPEIKKRVRYLTHHFYSPFGSVSDAKLEGKPVPRESMKPSDWWLAWATMPGFFDDAGNCQGFGSGLTTHGYEIASTEWNWNGWSGKDAVSLGDGLDWRHAAAIGCAGFLNGLLRHADVIHIANQSMLVGHSWGIAAIRVDPTGKMPTHYNAQGAATTFYNLHHGDRLLAIQATNVPVVAQPYQINWPTPRPKVALLDVVATCSDQAVFVHAINRACDADQEAELDLAALSPPDGKAVQHLLEATPEDQVAVRKGWMTERRQPVAIAGGKVRVTFPRRSVSIVEIPVILKPEVEATKPL